MTASARGCCHFGYNLSEDSCVIKMEKAKQFICNVCEAGFTNVRNVKRHQKEGHDKTTTYFVYSEKGCTSTFLRRFEQPPEEEAWSAASCRAGKNVEGTGKFLPSSRVSTPRNTKQIGPDIMTGANFDGDYFNDGNADEYRRSYQPASWG